MIDFEKIKPGSIVRVMCIKGCIPRDGYAAVLTKGDIYELDVRTTSVWFNDDDSSWRLYTDRYEPFFMELDQWRSSCIDKVLYE